MTKPSNPEIPSVPDHDALMEQIDLARKASKQIPGAYEQRDGPLLHSTIETIQSKVGDNERKIEVERRSEEIGLDDPIEVTKVTGDTPNGARVDYVHTKYPDGHQHSRGIVRVGDKVTPNLESASALMRIVAEGVEESARTVHRQHRKLQ